MAINLLPFLCCPASWRFFSAFPVRLRTPYPSLCVTRLPQNEMLPSPRDEKRSPQSKYVRVLSWLVAPDSGVRSSKSDCARNVGRGPLNWRPEAASGKMLLHVWGSNLGRAVSCKSGTGVGLWIMSFILLASLPNAMYNTIRSCRHGWFQSRPLLLSPTYTEVELSFTWADPLNWLYRLNRLWTCKLNDDMLARL